MSRQSESDIIEFVRKTTEAITVISEATKQQAATSSKIVDIVTAQKTANEVSFKELSGKMDGLSTMFKYVIVPLVAGILSLVGVKLLFKL